MTEIWRKVTKTTSNLRELEIRIGCFKPWDQDNMYSAGDHAGRKRRLLATMSRSGRSQDFDELCVASLDGLEARAAMAHAAVGPTEDFWSKQLQSAEDAAVRGLGLAFPKQRFKVTFESLSQIVLVVLIRL